jgi:hypothetical protein
MSPQPGSPPPSTPQAPPAGSGMQDYKSALGVTDQSSAALNAEQMRKQQIQSVSVQVQGLSAALDGISRQFPASSQSVMELKRNLTKLLVEIVGSSMSESQASTGAMG